MRHTYLLLLAGIVLFACAETRIVSERQRSIVDTPETVDVVVLPDTLYGCDTLHGSVEGVVKDCDYWPLPSAQILLIGLPNAMALKGYREVPWVFVNNPDSIAVQALSDSTGYFEFRELPIGLYEVRFTGMWRMTQSKSHCGAAGVLFVRVAQDSIALVNLTQVNSMLPIERPIPLWTREYRPME